MTEAEELRTELQEIRTLAEATLLALVGAKRIDGSLRNQQEWLQTRRLENGTPLYKLSLSQPGFWRLMDDADILTLEEVAAKTRPKVQSVEGVGPATMRKLDAAMSERGLSFAEVA